MTSAISSEARNEVQQASNNSVGFLSFSSSDSAVSKWVSDVYSSSAFTSITQNKSLVLRDAHNPDFIATLRDLLFPVVTRDQVVAAHMQEANSAAVSSTLSDADRLYAAALSQPGSSGAKVDLTKALAAINSGDMLSFLSNGFAFSSGDQLSTASFRRLRSANISNEDAQRINALLIDQVQLKEAITLATFPDIPFFSITKIRDNADHDLSSQGLIQLLRQQQVGALAPKFTQP